MTNDNQALYEEVEDESNRIIECIAIAVMANIRIFARMVKAVFLE